MTVINPKSISGITSITTPSGADDLLTIHTNDTTERFRVDGSGNTRITSGIVTTISIGAVTSVGDITSVGAISGDISIADKIVHTGDTNTLIRFNPAGTIRFDTDGDERLRITSAGKLLVGATSSRSTAAGDHKIQVESTSTEGISLTRTTADAGGINLSFVKTRNGAVVQSGDDCGAINWFADDGTDTNSYTARIQGAVDGTPGSNDTPGRLVFYTTADGAATASERLRINSVGKVGINSTAPDGMLAIEHTSSAPNLTMRNHPAAGPYTNEYGLELRHAYGSVKHGALIHTQEAADARRSLDVSDSNGIFATFVNHKVGINTTVPSSGHLMVESNGAYSIVSKSINGNGGYHVFTGQANNGTVTSHISHNGRGYFEDGVQFDSSGETLSDYEEGTWTPGMNFQTGTVTSYHNQEGTYTRVGRVVTAHFRLRINNAGGASGAAQISGLPFTVYDVMASTGLGGSGGPTYWAAMNTNIVQLNFTPEDNSTNCYIYYATSAQTTLSPANETLVGNNWDVRAFVTYYTTA